MQEEVKTGLYRHFKGKLYTVLGVATHSESGEQMVVYRAEYGDRGLWVRPYEMFFSPVDREKYPDAEQEQRFQYIGDPSLSSDRKAAE